MNVIRKINVKGKLPGEQKIVTILRKTILSGLKLAPKDRKSKRVNEIKCYQQFGFGGDIQTRPQLGFNYQDLSAILKMSRP